MSASSDIQIEDGIFHLTAGGGSSNAAVHTSDFKNGLRGGERKPGEKAGKTGDAVHSNAMLTIKGGTFEILTGDDAFHADDTLEIIAGTINIAESYEGLEGLHVIISGGDITLVASDDGLNAAGGADENGMSNSRDGKHSSSNGSITISGGTISVTASGDGIDANGTLEITGGYTSVCGPIRGDTATLDYDSTGTISGGVFIGTGAASMTQSFSSSEQGVIMLRVEKQPANTTIELSDSDQNTLITYTPNLEYEVVILSSPDIISGQNYTITIGSFSEEVIAD
ncbi:MAG: carbohydrate-binding domain-containing protein [Lachnospiraceae bacterium]|nr:carbohydrate-binding domain-containing protein [Lachnospiraceae bacterium]